MKKPVSFQERAFSLMNERKFNLPVFCKLCNLPIGRKNEQE